MRVEITARDLQSIVNPDPRERDYYGKEFYAYLEALHIEKIGGDYYIDVPDSTEKFLKLVEPLGRFSILYPYGLPSSPDHIILYFENDYD